MVLLLRYSGLRISDASTLWSGVGKRTSAVNVWQETFQGVFEKATVPNGHIHRFRHTFAVSLLQKGVSIEIVSVLLANSSIRITERHYAPWVKDRQERLEAAVRKAW